jgi:DNA-binding Xre family transcriptional regulator
MELGAKFPKLMTVLRLAAALECKVTDLVRAFDKSDLVSLLPM